MLWELAMSAVRLEFDGHKTHLALSHSQTHPTHPSQQIYVPNHQPTHSRICFDLSEKTERVFLKIMIFFLNDSDSLSARKKIKTEKNLNKTKQKQKRKQKKTKTKKNKRKYLST